MWVIECGLSSEDTRPLIGRDCNIQNPTSAWEGYYGLNRSEYGPFGEDARPSMRRDYNVPSPAS
ncbi:hypothetical protein PanWU01x14_293490, partial [Parasponia andersonii]